MLAIGSGATFENSNDRKSAPSGLSLANITLLVHSEGRHGQEKDFLVTLAELGLHKLSSLRSQEAFDSDQSLIGVGGFHEYLGLQQREKCQGQSNEELY